MEVQPGAISYLNIICQETFSNSFRFLAAAGAARMLLRCMLQRGHGQASVRRAGTAYTRKASGAAFCSEGERRLSKVRCKRQRLCLAFVQSVPMGSGERCARPGETADSLFLISDTDLCRSKNKSFNITSVRSKN
jgi:hypothetical protein